MHYQIPPTLNSCLSSSNHKTKTSSMHPTGDPFTILLIKRNIINSANIIKAYKRHNMYIWDQVACMLKNPTSPRIMCISRSHVFRL